MNFQIYLARLYTRFCIKSDMNDELERKSRMKKVLEKERESESLPPT